MTSGAPAAPPTRGAAPAVEAFPVLGMRAVRPGDDVPAMVVAELSRAGTRLADGDVVVVSSKIVAKAEGRAVDAPTAEAVERVSTRETVRVVAERSTPRGTTRIVVSRSGPVLAAAGVDASNVEPGTALPLPEDPDRSARELRDQLLRLTGAAVGVVVSDTAGRPWRDGQVDVAIGAAGIQVVDDLRGSPDTQGRPMEVTVRAVADEVASLADLVKGKVAGVPVAIVRGLGPLVRDGGDADRAARLLRPAASDWFRLGHVEAVRAALGVPPGSSAVPLPTVPAGPVATRFSRAVAVAVAAPSPLGRDTAGARALSVDVEVGGSTAVIGSDDVVELGALAQRLVAAGWAEDLAVVARLEAPIAGGLPILHVSGTDAGPG